jgi:GT2 family glycosyltransferase
VKFVRFDRNLGFAEAYNRAIATISEDLVVLLNNDVEVDDRWLVELRSAIEKSEESDRVAACGSMILFHHDRCLVNHAGGRLVPIGGGMDLDFGKRDDPTKHDQAFVGCVSGASMIMPRSLFLKIGGFDADFFAYFEDVDLCWRAWLAGYRILLIPSSRVYHKLGATTGPFLKAERLFLGERNRLQSMLKNLEFRNAVTGILVSALYNIVRIPGFLRSRKPGIALAILRGDLWTVGHLPGIVAKRREIQRHRVIDDAFLVRHGLMASLTEGVREFRRLEILRK